MASRSQLSGRALAALLPDLHHAPGSVYGALADAITALVLDGRVAPKTRLPSERVLAEQLGLSRATITAGYDALRERGFLASRTGSGSFVTVPTDARPGRLGAWAQPGLGSHPDSIDLTIAALPAPTEALAAALAYASERLALLANRSGYDPLGDPDLRAAIARRFTARGIPTDGAQIMITNGALHAADLLLRVLVGPGDRVLTELPTYPGVLDAVRANSARVVPVPMAADGGWQVGQMQATLRQTAPRLAFLIPDYHNPTGALIGEADRRDVLKVARATSTTVLVDESFVDLGYDGQAPPMAALDPSVITIGSLSKPVWGGIRVGWVRASPDLVRRLAVRRASIDLAGSALDQLLATALVADLDRIAEQRRSQLRPQRDTLISALARELPQWRVPVPAGGLSVWVELDAPLATPLSVALTHRGVQLVPGARFGVDGTLERFIRIPFSLPGDQLEEAVRRISLAWQEIDRSNAGLRQLVVA